MYFLCNLRIHVITLYSGHVCVYHASMVWCWHLIWILVSTDHPCLGVGCHMGRGATHIGGARTDRIWWRMARIQWQRAGMAGSGSRWA
jgi:hypothetical protein